MAKADYFLTCDDEIVRKTKGYVAKLKIMNPVDYFWMEVTK
jgi:hypothetical protein